MEFLIFIATVIWPSPEGFLEVAGQTGIAYPLQVKWNRASLRDQAMMVLIDSILDEK